MKRSFIRLFAACLLLLTLLPVSVLAAQTQEQIPAAVLAAAEDLPVPVSASESIREPDTLNTEYPCCFFIPYDGLNGSKYPVGKGISFQVKAYSRGMFNGSNEEHMYVCILNAAGEILCVDETSFSGSEAWYDQVLSISKSEELAAGTYYLYYFSTYELGNTEQDPMTVHVVDTKEGNAITVDPALDNHYFARGEVFQIKYTLTSRGFGGEKYYLKLSDEDGKCIKEVSGYFSMVPGEYACTMKLGGSLEPGNYQVTSKCSYAQRGNGIWFNVQEHGVTWQCSGGKLRISGEGELPDYTQGEQPWLKSGYAAENITEVTVGSGITSIGSNTFRDMPNLLTVSLPAGLTAIGDYAFHNTGVKTVNIPGTVSQIGKHAFSSCPRLASVTTDLTWKEGSGGIGSYAFANNTRLTQIQVPGSVRSIGSHAFSGSTELKNVYFRDEAVTFAADAFSGVTLIARYPSGLGSWAKDIMQNYGGQVTWYMHHPSLPGVDLQQPVAHKTGIILKWNAVRHAKTYQIYRKERGSSEWVLIDATGSFAYKDESAEQGGGYDYKVRACNGDRKSADSMIYYIKRPYMLPDVKMTKILAHRTGNIIYWEAVEDAKLYQVFRRTNGETTWELLKNTGSLAYKDESAELGVLYYYKVRARNGDMMSSLSINGLSASRPYPLADVKMTKAVGHRTGNIIYWEAVEGARFYQVYRMPYGGSSWTLLKNTGSLAYKDTSAEPGVKYRYKIRARNDDLMSSMQIKGLVAIRPNPLTTVNVTKTVAHSSGNLLYWDAVESAVCYRIYRRAAHKTAELIGTTGSLAYKDTTAEPGVTYYYQVVAVDSCGQTSSPTREFSLTRPKA